MSFCSLTKGITGLCVCVLINKRSFEPFTCLDFELRRFVHSYAGRTIPNEHLLHTLIVMGSAALATAVAYPGEATRISRKGQ